MKAIEDTKRVNGETRGADELSGPAAVAENQAMFAEAWAKKHGCDIPNSID